MRERKLPQELTIIAEAISTLGKYALALGTHYDPLTCYDVCAINRLTGECIRRHYRKKEEAYAFWDQFRSDMTKPRGPSEETEHDRYKQFRPS